MSTLKFQGVSHKKPAKGDVLARLTVSFDDFLILLAVASGFLLYLWKPFGFLLASNWGEVAAFGAPIFVSWGLAEYFARFRRMALTSGFLAFTYLFGILFSSLYVLDRLELQWFPESEIEPICLVGTGLAAWLHWRRFHVPIAVGAGVASLVFPALFLLYTLLEQFDLRASSLYLVMESCSLAVGAAVFSWAIHIDRVDRERLTSDSDIAFWLHPVAAFLIVNSSAKIFMETVFYFLDGLVPWVVLAPLILVTVFAFFAVISLVLDRVPYLYVASFYLFLAISAPAKYIGSWHSTSVAVSVTALVLLGLVFCWPLLVPIFANLFVRGQSATPRKQD